MWWGTNWKSDSVSWSQVTYAPCWRKFLFFYFFEGASRVQFVFSKYCTTNGCLKVCKCGLSKYTVNVCWYKMWLKLLSVLLLIAETEHAQRVPDTESAQQIRLRERQRFFEEVFQHDVDVYLSSAHLQIDYKRREFEHTHMGDSFHF